MNKTVYEIEEAVKDTLEADPELSGMARNFLVLDTLDRSELEGMCSLGPVVGVICVQQEFSGSMTNVTDETGRLSVVVLDRNLRSGVAGKSGAAGERGVWDILHRAFQVLHHHPERVNADIQNITAKKARLLFASRRACGVVMEAKVTWRHSN